MSEQQQWARMAGGGGGVSTVDDNTATPQQTQAMSSPVAAEQPAEAKGRRGKKKEKAAKAPKPPKAERAKAPKAPKQSKRERQAAGSLLSLAEGPSRQQLEQEAAAELTAAIAPSLDLLRVAVPDAKSPDEAYRAIESKLGPPVDDHDKGIPDHPIYKGDALVYAQLKRHYGSPHGGGSFIRSWNPGQS